MQITKKQKRRVAVFFLLGVLVFVGTIGVLIGNKLLKKENCYYTTFKDLSVSGLTQGSSVKFQGMNVGQVKDISIDAVDTTVVRIDVCIRPDVAIKEGTYANLGSIGITGLKFVELKGGGKGNEIPLKGLIPGKKSGLDDITKKASDITKKIDRILEKTDRLLSNLEDDSLKKLVDNVESITGHLNGILTENRSQIHSILKHSDSLLSGGNQTVNQVNAMLRDLRSLSLLVKKLTKPNGSVEQITTSLTTFTKRLANTDVDKTLNKTLEKVNELVASVTKTTDLVQLTMLRSKEAIINSVDDLSEGMEYFKEFTRIIMENPGAILRSNEE